jgi:hypothetical protein
MAVHKELEKRQGSYIRREDELLQRVQHLEEKLAATSGERSQYHDALAGAAGNTTALRQVSTAHKRSQAESCRPLPAAPGYLYSLAGAKCLSGCANTEEDASPDRGRECCAS